jgi:streptogramin lyase
VNEAFHRNLAVVDSSGAVQSYPIPVPPDGGPFASNLNFFGTSPVDFRTPMSITGDGIVVDSGGNVWFTEGGQNGYGGIYPNRSRIVRFDPGKKKFRVYDVPEDNSQVSAIAVVSGRVWFATGAHDVENYVENGLPVVVRAHVPAKIVSFDLGRIAFGDGTTIDYSRASLSSVCAVGSNDTSCYHEYPIPDSCTLGADGVADCTHGGWIATRPLSLLVAGVDGKVWYGDYGGPLARLPLFGSSFVIPSPGNNLVGRVQPTSVVSGSPAIDLFPLATPLVGGRPTAIAEATNGDIAISEYLDNTISLLRRTSVIGSPATCMQLQANHKNSCMSEAFVPDFSYTDVDGTKHAAVNGSTVDPGQGDGVYGIGYDGAGNLWFAQTGPDQPNRLPSLGYVSPDWTKVVRLPPMGIFPARTGYSGLGMTVAQNGDVWFADFLRTRVSRLRKTL